MERQRLKSKKEQYVTIDVKLIYMLLETKIKLKHFFLKKLDKLLQLLVKLSQRIFSHMIVDLLEKYLINYLKFIPQLSRVFVINMIRYLI